MPSSSNNTGNAHRVLRNDPADLPVRSGATTGDHVVNRSILDMINFRPPDPAITTHEALENALQSRRVYQSRRRDIAPRRVGVS